MKKTFLFLLLFACCSFVFSACYRTDWACHCYNKVHDTLTNHQYWDYGEIQYSRAGDMCRSHVGTSADTCYVVGYK